jgi:hypothetical protein
LLTADSRDAVDAFFYGASMAYGGLPEDLMREYRARMNKLLEGFANWPPPNWPPKGKLDPSY